MKFSELKVLDVTGEIGPYTAKMYADLGADVIHLEPLSGDPLRRIGPFYKTTPGSEAGLPYFYFNAGKRGGALDLAHERGRRIFRELCARADLLIESCVPGYLDGLGLSHAELSRENPKLVQTSITPFGRSGPFSQFPGSDLTCAALSGFLYLAGIGNDKPVRAPDNQSYRMAEAYAAAGSAIALYRSRRTGTGQLVDVACVEACAMALESSAQQWDLEGKVRRGRGREAGSASIHPCGDGYVVLVAILTDSKPSWEAFVGWMKGEGVEDWEVFEDDKWLESAYRASNDGYMTFCNIFERYSTKTSKLYIYETAQRYKVAVSPVSTGRDLLDNKQLSYLDFWKSVQNDALDGHLVYPGAPYEFGELLWKIRRNAPRFGEHTHEVLQELGYSPSHIDELEKSGAIYAEGT